MPLDFQKARERMVAEQLVRRDIVDKRLLAAMRKIPRHEFVPKSVWSQAYNDYPLPIGDGQTISQPYMVALMTQLLAVAPEHTVLEIGTGSGYQTAILAELARYVYSLERVKSLAQQARRKLEDRGYQNVTVIVGDGSVGYLEKAPYSRIIVTASAPGVPESLKKQLKLDGILVIPAGGSFFQDLIKIERTENGFRQTSYGGCTFVRLIGQEGWAH